MMRIRISKSLNPFSGVLDAYYKIYIALGESYSRNTDCFACCAITTAHL
jgi:hypothetical protein